MSANPAYLLVIDDYKNHLRSFPDKFLSFESFCRPYNVRSGSIRMWMRRRGLDVSMLYYEALLERSCTDPAVEAPLPFGSRRKSATSSLSIPDSAVKIKSSELIKGVCITFPDGVTVNIRQTSSMALSNFIESYNKIIDQRYVQPE